MKCFTDLCFRAVKTGPDATSEVDPIIRTTGGPALDSGRWSGGTSVNVPMLSA